MDVLSSRLLLRPSDPDRSHRFYRDTLGLAIHRQFGSPQAPGLVFFLGYVLLGGALVFALLGAAVVVRARRV